MTNGSTRRWQRALVVSLAAAALALCSHAAAAPGDLDPTFSDNGWVGTVGTSDGSNSYFPHGTEDLDLAPDGKILTAAELTDSFGAWWFGAFRYTASGELDSSFGEGGWVDTDLGSFDFPHTVAVQADGKVLVGGVSDCSGYVGCATLVRYTAAGELDPTFGGGDGIVKTKFANCGCIINDLVIQPDGRIVAAGWRYAYRADAMNQAVMTVTRYLPNGELDTSFSRDGKLSVDLGFGNDYAYTAALQKDGKIVLGGRGTPNWWTRGDDLAFVRLRRNGTLDPTFSGDGKRTVNFSGTRREAAFDLALQSDGKILGVGTSSVDHQQRPWLEVVRLRPDGRLDPSFSGDGKLQTRGGAYAADGLGIAQARDSKVVVSGQAFADYHLSDSQWLLLRYTASGAPDPSFGTNGAIRGTPPGPGSSPIYDAWAGPIAVQADGKLIVSGSLNGQTLARFLPN